MKRDRHASRQTVGRLGRKQTDRKGRETGMHADRQERVRYARGLACTQTDRKRDRQTGERPVRTKTGRHADRQERDRYTHRLARIQIDRRETGMHIEWHARRQTGERPVRTQTGTHADRQERDGQTGERQVHTETGIHADR